MRYIRRSAAMLAAALLATTLAACGSGGSEPAADGKNDPTRGREPGARWPAATPRPEPPARPVVGPSRGLAALARRSWRVSRELPLRKAATAVALSHDARLLLVGVGKQLRAFETATGRALEIAQPEPACFILGLQVSRDGAWLVGRGPQPVVCWSLDKNRRVAEYQEQPRASIVAISPRGRFAASVGAGGQLNLFEVGRTLLRPVKGVGGGVAAVAFSPDGRELAVLCRQGLMVCDVASGAVTRKLSGERMIRGGGGLAYSADGKKLWVARRPYVVSRTRSLNRLDCHDAGNGARLSQRSLPERLESFSLSGTGRVALRGRTWFRVEGGGVALGGDLSGDRARLALSGDGRVLAVADGLRVVLHDLERATQR